MINQITQKDLAKHAAWLRNEPEGVRIVTVVDADLSDANLSGADLSGANLRDAENIPDYVTAITSIVPDGDLVVYKQLAGNDIATLKIPASAGRSNATSRKCRAEYAEVLAIQDTSGNAKECGVSRYDVRFVYRVGETVHPHEWCEDRWQECAGGIHFYLTRYEAENN